MQRSMPRIPGRRRKPDRFRKLRVEPLEDRRLLAVLFQSDFESFTTEGWSQGPFSSNPPFVNRGGPGGGLDSYLSVNSSGLGGAGGKFTFFNESPPWQGNLSNVAEVRMDVTNLGATPLDLRIAVDGSGGRFVSIDAERIDPGADWARISFPIDAVAFESAGGSDFSLTLSSVTQFRIISSSGGSDFQGDIITAAAGFDNITAHDAPATDSLDFGDAPDLGIGQGPGDYQTLLEDNGPRHAVSPDLFIGFSFDGPPDEEPDGQPNNSADGDDVDLDGDDEEGVFPFGVMIGEEPFVLIDVINTTPDIATLYGWIDYNRDGVFDNLNERAIDVVFPGNTTSILNFPQTPFDTPLGETYARFRLSTDPAAADPFGFASDGEVEDHQVTIEMPELIVDTDQDFIDGYFGIGGRSLREAIALANRNPGPDTITFDSTFDFHFFSQPRSINLINGSLAITDDLTIRGPSQPLTISGRNQSRIFDVDDENAGSQIDVEISGLTLTGGMATSLLRGVSSPDDDGGAILNRENLTLLKSTLTGNEANIHGGAIANSGTLTLRDSTIDGNMAGFGGGIYNVGDLNLENSTISGNTSSSSGGGIYTSNSATIENTTITGNQATQSGGGIASVAGTPTLTNTIVAANVAQNGPDIDGTVTAHFSLIGNGDNSGLNIALPGSPDVNGNIVGPIVEHFDLSTLFNSDAVVNGDANDVFDSHQDAPDTLSFITETYAVSIGFAGDGLPDDGVVPAGHGDLNFDVPLGFRNDDDGDNAISLRSGADEALFTLPAEKQQPYQKLLVYATNAGGDGVMHLDLMYTDATTETVSQPIDDWFNDGGELSSGVQYLVDNLKRVNNDGSNEAGVPVDPAIFFVEVPADGSKSLDPPVAKK